MAKLNRHLIISNRGIKTVKVPFHSNVLNNRHFNFTSYKFFKRFLDLVFASQNSRSIVVAFVYSDYFFRVALRLSF